MPPKENPTTEGRASCVSFDHWTHDALTLSAYRAQHLIASRGIRPKLAVMMAACALGGGAHHG